MAISQQRKDELIKEYRVHETDTGSPEEIGRAHV